MTQNEAKKLILKSIESMLLEDAKSDPKLHLLETSERNITAHLRGHMARLFSDKPYQVDHEYNKMKKDRKQVAKVRWSKEEDKVTRMIPDILIHQRGIEIADEPDANQVAIEVKNVKKFEGAIERIGNKAKREGLEKDKSKLQVLASGNFKYKNTCSLIFSRDNPREYSFWMSFNLESYEKVTL